MVVLLVVSTVVLTASNSKRDLVLMLSIFARMMSGILRPLLFVVLRTSSDAFLSSSSSVSSSTGSISIRVVVYLR